MPLSIVILAAGQGTRMKSSRPKVVHPVAGRPMLQHVVDTSRLLDPDQVIVVIGHASEQIREAMQGQDLIFVEQHILVILVFQLIIQMNLIQSLLVQ